ncbi:hypothetical protein [Cellulosimicrobium sp. CUA-896]|uniref:hypothetical protein n=1 Tax=Cellulosimicrobium sp. CUA-896 TaxID=1517881 RepID=UPI002101B4F0|nr:hypothetical protein [Cellulosimicrobium sp. CUA-896]
MAEPGSVVDGAADTVGPVPAERVVAVVPLRDGTSGKSRLASVLDADARSRLVAVLARHVMTTLLAGDTVERVVVVTADPRFAWRALSDVVVDRATQGPPTGPRCSPTTPTACASRCSRRTVPG